MKKLFILGPLALMMACHSASAPSDSSADSSKTAQQEAAIDTLATLVARVQQQSRLYAADCMVHKVVLFTDKSQIDGGLVKFNKVGYRKIAIPIDVTLKGYIDFCGFLCRQRVARRRPAGDYAARPEGDAHRLKDRPQESAPICIAHAF